MTSRIYSKAEERKKFEDQVSDFIVKTKRLEEDLENNKKTYDDYKEATTTKMGVLEDNIASLEQRIQNNQKEFEATMRQNNEDHKKELSIANAALVKEYNRGREDATQELLAKQSGGEVVDESDKEKVNPFIVKSDVPPVLSRLISLRLRNRADL